MTFRNHLMVNVRVLAITFGAAAGVQAASAQDIGGWLRRGAEAVVEQVTEPSAPLEQSRLQVPASSSKSLSEANEHYDKTIAQGAALGLIAGAVICNQFDNLSRAEKLACTAGITVISTVGAKSIADRNTKLIVDRSKVNAALEAARKNRDASRALLTAVNENIDFLELEVVRLKDQLARNAIDRASYNAGLADIRAYAGELSEKVKKVEKQATEQQEQFEDLKSQADNSDDPDVRAAAPEIEEEARSSDEFLEVEVAESRRGIGAVEVSLG